MRSPEYCDTAMIRIYLNMINRDLSDMIGSISPRSSVSEIQLSYRKLLYNK